jgi:hypothetical protein
MLEWENNLIGNWPIINWGSKKSHLLFLDWIMAIGEKLVCIVLLSEDASNCNLKRPEKACDPLGNCLLLVTWWHHRNW